MLSGCACVKEAAIEGFMRYTTTSTMMLQVLERCSGMAHTPSKLLFAETAEQDTLSCIRWGVLLTLEQTQEKYALLLEHHPVGSNITCTTAEEGQWTCYVVAGTFTFQQEGKAQEEHFVAQQGDVVALPSNVVYQYALSKSAAGGQLLIFQFPEAEVHHRSLVQAHEGSAYAVITDVGVFKLSTDDTHGGYILMLWHVPPQGGPAIHTQSGEESFYILEGNFAFRGLHEGQPYTLIAGKGDVVHAQERVPHSYQNTGQIPGKMLVIMAPAGRSQAFFQEIGQEIREIGTSFPVVLPDPITLMNILQKYDVAIFP